MSEILDLTPTNVVDFWRHMTERFRATVVDKRQAPEMWAVAAFLGATGIQKPNEFMERYTTTIDRRIYPCFTVGVSSDHASLWDQVACVTHEAVHLCQQDRLGLAYQVSYLASKTRRAQFEAEAYTTRLELEFWRYGTLFDVERLAQLLSAYAYRPVDIAVAADTLRSANATIRRGGHLTEASRTAIEWLDANVPHIRQVAGPASSSPRVP